MQCPLMFPGRGCDRPQRKSDILYGTVLLAAERHCCYPLGGKLMSRTVYCIALGVNTAFTDGCNCRHSNHSTADGCGSSQS